MNIFDHVDARQWLKERWAELKAGDAKYSARFISREMGFGNPIYFTRILSGERGLTGAGIDSLIRIFKLTGEEADYFRYLCFYTDEEDAVKKEFFLDKLISMNNTTKKHLVQAEFRFHKEWHHNAIWAALDVVDSKGTAEECAALGARLFPKVPGPKVKESLNLLKELGFIAKDGAGCWKPKGKAIFANARLQDAIVKRYWLASLEQAGKAIDAGAGHPRVYTNTFSCSAKAQRKIHDKLDKLSSEIRAIITKDGKSERVVQFQFQMFDQLQDREQA